MAHHYGEFFINYNFPIPPVKTSQTSGSVEQQNDKKEENKEAKCSNTTK
tara:strand:- start:266 stop:412 length:147 start_codon:yes stop_codon:yes gene_type:complete